MGTWAEQEDGEQAVATEEVPKVGGPASLQDLGPSASGRQRDGKCRAFPAWERSAHPTVLRRSPTQPCPSMPGPVLGSGTKGTLFDRLCPGPRTGQGAAVGIESAHLVGPCHGQDPMLITAGPGE